jgi:hypothetical protein
MDKLSDLEINCGVRKVLVRHWTDLGKISVRTTSGVATFSGELVKLPHIDPPFTSSSVTEMINEIKRLPAVRRVQLNLSNWVECDGVWRQHSSRPIDLQLQSQKRKASGVYDLTEFEEKRSSNAP